MKMTDHDAYPSSRTLIRFLFSNVNFKIKKKKKERDFLHFDSQLEFFEFVLFKLIENSIQYGSKFNFI